MKTDLSWVEQGNNGPPHQVTGYPSVYAALRVSVTDTVTGGASMAKQPASGLPYPPKGTPCVDLVLWRPSGEIVEGGYVTLSIDAAVDLAEALLATARRARGSE